MRLTLNQRAQHWALLTSFIALVVSGFALVYPGAWHYYLGLEAEATRRRVHRVAAVVMMCVGVYHVFYLAAARGALLGSRHGSEVEGRGGRLAKPSLLRGAL